jgi:hypothetical protein
MIANWLKNLQTRFLYAHFDNKAGQNILLEYAYKIGCSLVRKLKRIDDIFAMRDD